MLVGDTFRFERLNRDVGRLILHQLWVRQEVVLLGSPGSNQT